MYSDEEGRAAVRFARAVIQEHLGGEAEMPGLPPSFDGESGAFVTLVTHPRRDLRGCIGYIEAIKPLGRTIADVAVSAAVHDPRFPGVTLAEMDRLAVEVSLLTPLEPVPGSGEGLIENVVVGLHGLVVERGRHRGVLLPQVPVEHGWDARTFVKHTCLKAGLPPNAWLEPGTRFLRFTAEVFEEVEPRGEVRRKDLGNG
ncbi:MAG: TIGR00296 family protein [Thermoplasmata archaeon]|nr:TIGR00296 family protein [Thermoplasmata archaeon]